MWLELDLQGDGEDNIHPRKWASSIASQFPWFSLRSKGGVAKNGIENCASSKAKINKPNYGMSSSLDHIWGLRLNDSSMCPLGLLVPFSFTYYERKTVCWYKWRNCTFRLRCKNIKSHCLCVLDFGLKIFCWQLRAFNEETYLQEMFLQLHLLEL